MSASTMSTQDIVLKVLDTFDQTDKEDIGIVAKQYNTGRDSVYQRNNTAELERLEKALKEIKDKKVDKEFAKDKFTEILIDNLYSQIAFLKEEVGYLRDYSKIKGRITNIITENVPGATDHRITIEDDTSSQSNNQSPLTGSAPSTIATYFMQGPNDKHNALSTSQQLDGDVGNDCTALLITSNQLNNQFSNNYPIGISNHLSNDASNDNNDRMFLPRHLSNDNNELGEHRNSLGSSDELYNDTIHVHKNPLLSDDENSPDPPLPYHSIFTTDGIPRMNERWQSAVIFMIVMSFLILVCCLIPIILIPR